MRAVVKHAIKYVAAHRPANMDMRLDPDEHERQQGKKENILKYVSAALLLIFFFLVLEMIHRGLLISLPSLLQTLQSLLDEATTKRNSVISSGKEFLLLLLPPILLASSFILPHLSPTPSLRFRL